jgi:hypothetical protein
MVGFAVHARSQSGRSGPLGYFITRSTALSYNNQRLRGIEVEAAPWVWGMARGFRQPTALPPTAQRQLAAFALRMVAVGQYTRPQLRPVPRAHREHFVTHRTPPPLVGCWAFYCEGNDATFRVLSPTSVCANVPRASHRRRIGPDRRAEAVPRTNRAARVGRCAGR